MTSDETAGQRLEHEAYQNRNQHRPAFGDNETDRSTQPLATRTSASKPRPTSRQGPPVWDRSTLDALPPRRWSLDYALPVITRATEAAHARVKLLGGLVPPSAASAPPVADPSKSRSGDSINEPPSHQRSEGHDPKCRTHRPAFEVPPRRPPTHPTAPAHSCLFESAPRGARAFERRWKDSVAAPSQRGGEAGGSLTREMPGRAGSSRDKVGMGRYCQTARVR